MPDAGNFSSTGPSFSRVQGPSKGCSTADPPGQGVDSVRALALAELSDEARTEARLLGDLPLTGLSK